jgi:hypothetical protein
MSTYPGQNPVLQFPNNPVQDQEFVGDNGATYMWTGDAWSSTVAIVRKTAKYIVDGEYADSTETNILDGNGA